MSATLEAKPSRGAAWLEWAPVVAGLLLLYVPVFYSLSTDMWQQDDHAHGPIILGVIVWLIWRKRHVFFTAPVQTAPVSGFLLLGSGLLIYIMGHALPITIFEVGSLAPILAGGLLAMRGLPALRALWFPILFIAFMVPLPGTFVDPVTGLLKQHVSEIAERLLYAAGYPVARNGVVLTVGQYQLLVADACAGLNSMFSLSALGLLYLYLMEYPSKLRNGIILMSILPIAFIANIVRVVALVLITYHFGDEAGQGFLHGAAGIVLLLAALTIIVLLDSILAIILRPQSTTSASA